MPPVHMGHIAEEEDAIERVTMDLQVRAPMAGTASYIASPDLQVCVQIVISM